MAAVLVGRLSACGGRQAAGVFSGGGGRASYSVSRQLARVNGLVRGKPPPPRPPSGPASNPVATAVVRFGGKVVLCAAAVVQAAPLNAEQAIIATPTEVKMKSSSGGGGFLADLRQIFLNLASHLMTLARALQLVLVCTPLLALSPFAYRSERHRERWFALLVSTLEFCGPIHVKLGQWASSRLDLFPHRMCQVLSKLQRRIRQHGWRQTEETLKRNFGADCLSDVFADFEREPVGSGCCAQVYRATLAQYDGVEVAVKVLHPNVESRFRRDLRLMRTFADFATWMFPDLNWLSMKEGLDEFAALMKSQLDLSVEAKNLSKFRENFSKQPEVVFPRPFLDLCHREVIVESYERGKHINEFIDKNKNTITKKGIALNQRIARIGVRMCLKMIFTDNLVHADLHPGNILVRNSELQYAAPNQLVILDPGIVSSLSPTDLDNIRSVFGAVVKGDGYRVGELFLDRSKHFCTDRESFIKAMDSVMMEAIKDGELNVSRLNVSDLLSKVFNTLLTHRVKLDASFTSVMIAVTIIEGIGKALDPRMNLLTEAAPFLI